MNAGASLSAVTSPIEGSGTAWVLLGSWALSPARPTPIPPRHECRGFSALLVIERTNAWHGRYRRNSKDYERTVESSTAMIQMSNIDLMLNRLSPCGRPAFHYRTDAA